MELLSFIPLITLFIYLLIIGFVVYFFINVLQFMRKKNHTDELLLKKFDELSQKLDALNKGEEN